MGMDILINMWAAIGPFFSHYDTKVEFRQKYTYLIINNTVTSINVCLAELVFYLPPVKTEKRNQQQMIHAGDTC